MSAPLPADATLTWKGGLAFDARIGNQLVTLDSEGQAGPSPMQSLLLGLAGCMSVDVADILTKGRHTFDALEARLVGQRAPDPPRRYTAFTMHFIVTGPVPEAAMTRAIQLSRDKYCSVWHSLRQDITLDTSFEIR